VCHVLQNHENDYNYWQSQHSGGSAKQAELDHGNRSPDRSLLDDRDQYHTSFKDIYTYPMSMDYYDLDLDKH